MPVDARVRHDGTTNLRKAQGLQPVTNANFGNDVNASGAIHHGRIKRNAFSQLTPELLADYKH